MPASPEAGRDLALVHRPARGQRRVFGMLDDQAAERAGVCHGPAHHQTVGDGAVAVGEADRARFLEQGELGHAHAGAAARDRTVGIDLGALQLPGPARDELDHRRIVDRRHRVGQARKAGHAARRRRRGAAGIGLLVLGAGLAQLHAHVDQPRRQARAAAIDDLGIFRRRPVQVRAEVGDQLALDHQPAGRVQVARRIQQADADDCPARAHAAARSSRVSVSRQAMRTATPSST